MGESSKYYNAEEYISGKKNQGKNVRNPPGANFLAAANHIRKFFDGKNFNWAAFGGLAIHCLGSRREIADIHIVYDDRDFHRIQTKLEADSRMRLPQGMNALFPSKLLLSTGPKYKDAGCTENMDIEVNIVPPGMLLQTLSAG
ncbi:hypothetical protein BDV95DRAFT_47673 [Massariosphaeria phaeospora]|uniref:LicD family-domain-containing protein n=1 Tax=Massariosphaeria phaeospora TaxID=100035 RepID=A0A7C8I631_9PLEO|nr:hypothetical protein BDV95DRAFT_47673 [Massariosphaeria phaeospora]